jgi:hypothetical protein
VLPPSFETLPDDHKDCFIVPFGLQLLIENAVKHNVISRKNPLRIVIQSTPCDAIRVENNLFAFSLPLLRLVNTSRKWKH